MEYVLITWRIELKKQLQQHKKKLSKWENMFDLWNEHKRL